MADGVIQSAAKAEAASVELGAVLRGVGRGWWRGTLSVVGGLAIWELLSRYLVANALFLAAPSQIVHALITLSKSGQLGHHIAVSSIEFVLGYVIARTVPGRGVGAARSPGASCTG